MKKDFNFNSLNESNGSIFFNDEHFKKKVEYIVELIKRPTNDMGIIAFKDDFRNSYNIQFYHKEINLFLSWIDKLDIYYTYDKTFKFIVDADAKAPSVKDNSPIFNSTVSIEQIDDKTEKINYGPIFIYVDTSLKLIDFNKHYCGILYHEIGHLFDILYKKNNTNEDFNYIFNEKLKPIKILRNTITSYNENDIRMFIKWLLYFGKSTESHGFNEQTYFQILNACQHIRYLVRKLKRKNEIENKDINLAYNNDYILKNISDEIGNIYDLKTGCEFLIKNLDKFEIDIDEINLNTNKNFNKKTLFQYLEKQINHLWNNILKNFNYFSDLYNVQENKLLESVYQTNFAKWGNNFTSSRKKLIFDKEKMICYYI